MSSPFTSSPDTPAVAAAKKVAILANQSYATLHQNFQAAFATVWSNALATPMEVVASMGLQADKIFAASSATATLLNSLGASPALATTIPSGFTYTSTGDGSATLVKNS